MSKAVKPKPFNGGTWTVARMRSFAMSAVRRAQWGPKFKCLNRAYHSKGPRGSKLHKCEISGELFKKGDMHADHIEPVVPIDGKWGNTTEWLGYNWNELLPRLWCEEEGFQVISKELHKQKSKEENAARRASAKAE